jgi:hypothetical protein
MIRGFNYYLKILFHEISPAKSADFYNQPRQVY